jgi:transcriptional antiterminator RfaH
MVGILEEKMIDSLYKWYPIYTRSRAEKKMQIALQQKDIVTYLPLIKVEKQWSDRKKIVLEPLFRSYLFVYISAKEYAEVLMTYGMSHFIYFGSSIISIPTKQLEDLKLLLSNSNDLEVNKFEAKPGEKVIIKSGPFKGILAELIYLKNNQKIVLRLENLGYIITVNTSISNIERVY